MIDGDGWITLCGPTRHLTVAFSMRDGDVAATVQAVQDRFGCHVYRCARATYWQATGPAALRILGLLAPYVIEKRKRCDAALAHWRSDRSLCARIFDEQVEEHRVERYAGSVRAATTDDERAYAAGFFDADGSVGISHGRTKKLSKTGKPRCEPISLYVNLAQSDCRPLVWIADRWGGTVYCRSHRGPCVGYVHVLQLNGAKAMRFLGDIAPHVLTKREEVELVLSRWRFAENSGGASHYVENVALRHERLVLKSELVAARRRRKGAGARRLTSSSPTV